MSTSFSLTPFVVLEFDKPLYKPGDVVRMRVIVLNNERRVYTNSTSSNQQQQQQQLSMFVELIISDARDLKIAKVSETIRDGVAELVFEVDPGANIGIYNFKFQIKLGTRSSAGSSSSLSGNRVLAEKSTKIEIKEYVLPKFDLSVTYSLNNYLVFATNAAQNDTLTRNLEVSIKSQYTFGEYVVGEVEIACLAVSKGWEWNSSSRKSEEVEVLTKLGTLGFVEIRETLRARNSDKIVNDDNYLRMQNLKINVGEAFYARIAENLKTASSYNYYGQKIRFAVKITDPALGIAKTHTQDFEIFKTAFLYEIELFEYREFFSPGLPLRGLVKRVKPDGATPDFSKAFHEELNLIVQYSLEGYNVQHADVPLSGPRTWPSSGVPKCGDLELDPWKPLQSQRGCTLPVFLNKDSGVGNFEITVPNDLSTVGNCCNLDFASFNNLASAEKQKSCCLQAVSLSLEKPFEELQPSLRFYEYYNMVSGSSSVCLGRRWTPKGGFYLEVLSESSGVENNNSSSSSSSTTALLTGASSSVATTVATVVLGGSSHDATTTKVSFEVTVSFDSALPSAIAWRYVLISKGGRVLKAGALPTPTLKTEKRRSSDNALLHQRLRFEEVAILPAATEVAFESFGVFGNFELVVMAERSDFGTLLGRSNFTTTFAKNAEYSLRGNSVTTAFAADTVKPGESIGLRVDVTNFASASTSAGEEQRNAVYLVAVDKGVNLLGASRVAVTQNAISRAGDYFARNFDISSSSSSSSESPQTSNNNYQLCTPNAQDENAKSQLQSQASSLLVNSDGSVSASSALKLTGKTSGGSGGLSACPRVLFGGCQQAYPVAVDMAVAADGGAGVPERGPTTKSSSSGSSGASSSQKSSAQVRTFFPETWIWEKLQVVSKKGATNTTSVVLGSGSSSSSSSIESFDTSKDTIFESLDSTDQNVFKINLRKKRSPETISTFELHAFAVSSEGGLGFQSKTSDLKIFKDTFVNLQLPYKCFRNEKFTAVLTVLSYASVSLTDQKILLSFKTTDFDFVSSRLYTSMNVATVSLESPVNDKLSGDTVIRSAAFTLEPDAFARFDFVLVAKKISSPGGTIPLKVELVNVDAVVKNLQVFPEGLPVVHTDADVISIPSGAPHAELTLNAMVKVPSNAVVEDSFNLVLQATHDVLGPDLLKNLDNLLRIPYGCGEQNMVSLTPNVAVAKAYRAAGTLSGSVKKTIFRNLRNGVQRQVRYRHSDGSFSAFGESSAFSGGQPATGSLWLTAFVLNIFAEIATFVLVDPALLTKAASFLMNAQDANTGEFVNKGQLFHKAMMGGAENWKPALTAYILVSLLSYYRAVQSSSGSFDLGTGELALVRNSVSRGLTYLRGRQALLSRYTSVLLLRAEVLNVVSSSSGQTNTNVNVAPNVFGEDVNLRRAAILEALENLKVTSSSSSRIGSSYEYWPATAAVRSTTTGGATGGATTTTTTAGTTSSRYFCGGLVSCRKPETPIDIEMTGYALSILVDLNELGRAYQAVKYLAQMRGPRGGFISTQDTVVALSGLSDYGSSLSTTSAQSSAARVEILRSSSTSTSSTTEDSSLLRQLQQQDGEIFQTLNMTRDLFHEVNLLDLYNEKFSDKTWTGSPSVDAPANFRFRIKHAQNLPLFLALVSSYNVKSGTKKGDGTPFYNLEVQWVKGVAPTTTTTSTTTTTGPSSPRTTIRRLVEALHRSSVSGNINEEEMRGPGSRRRVQEEPSESPASTHYVTACASPIVSVGGSSTTTGGSRSSTSATAEDNTADNTAENEMVLVRIGLFSGFSLVSSQTTTGDNNVRSSCPGSSKCEQRDDNVFVYFSKVSERTCATVPLTEDATVEFRRNVNSEVFAYYDPTKFGFAADSRFGDVRGADDVGAAFAGRFAGFPILKNTVLSWFLLKTFLSFFLS